MKPIPSDRRTRVLTVSVLLGGHVVAYVVLSALGIVKPFEFFNVLCLVANFVIGGVLLATDRDLLVGAGMMFLVAAHAFVGHRLAPDSLTSGAILLVNILVLYVGVKINENMPARYWFAFIASFFILFVVFIVFMENAEALFLLFLMGLAACARSFRLLCYFWAVTASFTFCQPYAWEAAFVSVFVVTAAFGARGRAPSPTAMVFLVGGLALVFLVLLPVLIMIMGEDLHNVLTVLGDPRIRSAIWVTVRTATFSTLVLAAFAVPLAYALSRLRFPGRTLLLSLIDVPIVIPQSVAGIALVRVFGPRQFLGETLERVFGLSFDGTLLGICLAQIFVAMPFITKSAIAAFDAVDEDMELVARTLGAPSRDAFARVALPLAARGIFLGAVLAWARAAGEFGAVIFIAPTPESAPVAAFNRFNAVGVSEAAPLVAALLAFSLVMFFLLQLVARALPTAHGQGEGRR